MSRQSAIAAVLIVLVGSSFLAGAQRPSQSDVLLVYGLSAYQRDAIWLSISSHAASSDFFTTLPVTSKVAFRVGEPIYIGIIMTNTARECLRVCAFSNPYYQNRPRLRRNGELLMYSEKIREGVRQSDAGELCEFFRPPDIVNLKPNEPYRARGIELLDWYGSLDPGHYELYLRRTFACCADGQWSLTNLISFDVTL